MSEASPVAAVAPGAVSRRGLPAAHAGGRFGLGVAALLVLTALLAPVLSPYSPEAIDLPRSWRRRAAHHLLGAGRERNRRPDAMCSTARGCR